MFKAILRWIFKLLGLRKYDIRDDRPSDVIVVTPPPVTPPVEVVVQVKEVAPVVRETVEQPHYLLTKQATQKPRGAKKPAPKKPKVVSKIATKATKVKKVK